MFFRSVFVTAYFSCLLPTRPAICILSFVNLFDFSSVELKLCKKTIEVQLSMTDQRIIFKANNQKKSMSKTACLDHQSLKASGKVFWCVSTSTSYFRFYNFSKSWQYDVRASKCACHNWHYVLLWILPLHMSPRKALIKFYRQTLRSPWKRIFSKPCHC